VLMDIVLKGEMDGIDAAEQIRDNLGIPVIYLTAYADDNTLQRAKTAGPYGYIIKPFEERELRSSIEIALHKKEMEKKREHISLVLRAVRDVNQCITKEKDLDTLLQGVCANLTEVGAYGSAWIALTDETGMLTTVAEAGLGDDFSLIVEMMRRKELPICQQKVLSQPGVLAIENVSAYCECSLSERYQGRGALISRLEFGGKTYGVLTVSVPADFVKDEQELSLFDEVVGDVAFALGRLELENERGRAEEVLRKNEARYRLLADNVMDMIWASNLKGQFTYVSPSVINLLGYTSDEATGMTWEECLTPASADVIQMTLEEELASSDMELDPRGSITLELESVRKDGSTVWTEMKMTFLRDQDGELTEIIGLMSDITNRKKMISDLKQANEELRGTQSQLIQWEKLASIGTLASGIAHEINNPLAAITGYAEAILEENDAERIKGHATKIVDAADRVSDVVRRLSKHSKETIDENMVEVGLNDVLRDSLEAMKLRKSSPNIEVIANYEEIPPVKGNRNELQQVFVNLLKNSAEAMPEGGKLIISTRAGGEQVEVRISDTGVGIPEEHTAQIFDPFFTTKEVGEGTGLGLYVASTIMLRHRGTVDVDSEEGKGTTLKLRFPTADQTSETEKDAGRQKKRREPPKPNRKP
ncbi:MAG: ATP-binding protein, partial [Thermoplasmata archaeon]